MSFTGNLKTVPFSDLLQLIFTGKKSGLLQLKRQTQQKRIYFVEGNIVFASSGDKCEELLGKLFLKKGKISQKDFERALFLYKTQKKKITKTLLELGILTQLELVDAIKLQTEEIVYSIFSWNQGDFEFLDRRLPDKDQVITELNTMNVIMESVKRIDELTQMQKLLPPDGVALKVNSLPPLLSAQVVSNKIELSSEELQTFLLVNGERTLPEIVELSPLVEFDTYKSLHRLLTDKLVLTGEKKKTVLEKKREEELLFENSYKIFSTSFLLIEDILERKLGKGKEKIFKQGFISKKAQYPILADLIQDGIFNRKNFFKACFSIPKETRLHQVSQGLNALLLTHLKNVKGFLGKNITKKTISLIKKETASIFDQNKYVVKKYNLDQDFYGTLREIH